MGGLVLNVSPVRILIVEDDPDMSEVIADLVESEGWEAIRVFSAEEALERIDDASISLLLVDHNLPGISGRSLAQRFRRDTDKGIIMVTAAGSSIDRVLGLETAADDYVVKPFEPIELAARIKAVLRRSGNTSRTTEQPERQVNTKTIKIGDWLIDLEARMAYSTSNPVATLTNAEFSLLEILAAKPGTSIDRVEILQRLGSDGRLYIDRNIDVLVLRLRRKIERNPSMPKHIKTNRGKGYMLVLDAAEQAAQ
ncbi:response regulator transcription factor [Phyllobacterium sp. 628]|uniref:response regulator transcription factor n=1 Tax=Phyllobacterium sp. 628 TaxID=2718938 RepID=UPI002113469B|nr:response regulator transcription factor [Phyllobacterium sp. 628]